MSIKDKHITIFERVTSGNSATVNLLKVLTTDKYRDMITSLRNKRETISPDEFRQLKKELLPAFCTGGVYSGGHSYNNLVEASNCIALDFDHLPDLQAAKEAISQQPFVSYCGLSCSGTGLFAVVELSGIDNFRGRWQSLFDHFSRLGLEVDKATKDMNRMRYVSYDPDYFLNLNAAVYNDFVSQPIYTPSPVRKTDSSDVDRLIRHIINTRTDITSGRNNWLKIGSSIAGVMGSLGEDAFLTLSSFNPTFREHEARYTYQNYCMKKPLDKGVIFNIAANYGINVKSLNN